MMATRLCTVVFAILLCFFVVKSEEEINGNGNGSPEQQRLYSEHVRAVLSYLNATPVKVYTYKYGKVVSAQEKADITELTLDVSVDCANNYPDLPCTDDTQLICNAYVRCTAEGASEILGDVKCKPKVEIIVEDVDGNRETDPVPPMVQSVQAAEQTSEESVGLSNEAISTTTAVSGEQFVAIKKDTALPCLGCPFDLNPNVDGVQALINLALRHIESERNVKQHAGKVLRLQQQVVAGVKYYLLLEVEAPLENATASSDVVSSTCQIVYLQKPWISKTISNIIANNCTVSQEFRGSEKTDDDNRLRDRNDMSNEIDANNYEGNNEKSNKMKPFLGHDKIPNNTTTNFDRIAESGVIIDDDNHHHQQQQIQTPEEDRLLLSDLESHIVFAKPTFVAAPSRKDDGYLLSTKSPRFSVENQAVDDSPSNSQNTEQIIINGDIISEPSTINQDADEIDEKVDGLVSLFDQPLYDQPIVNDRGSSEEKSSEENGSKSMSSSEEDEKMKQVDNLKVKIPLATWVNVDEDDDDGQQTAVVSKKIPAAKWVNVDEQPATPTDDQQNDNEEKTSNSSMSSEEQDGTLIVDSYQSIPSSIDDQKMQTERTLDVVPAAVAINMDRSNDSTFLLDDILRLKRSLGLLKEIDSGEKYYNRRKRQTLVGGQQEIFVDSPKIQKFLENSLLHLDSQLLSSSSGNNNKRHKVVKIDKVTSQVVAGIMYRIKTEIALSDDSEKRICDIEVWDRSWLSHTQTKIRCDNDNKREFTFETNTNKNKSKRSVRDQKPGGIVPLLGGVMPESPDNIKAQQYVNHALAHLDSSSSGHGTKSQINEIVAVSRQIVAGELWRIKAKITQSNDKHSVEQLCDFKVWDQPWLKENGRETNITCDNKLLHSYRTSDQLEDKVITKRDILKGHRNNNYKIYEMRVSMFTDFIKKYDKLYGTEKELKYRFNVFSKNMKYVNQLNKYEQGTAKYSVMTPFGDRSHEEFSQSLGLREDLRNDNNVPFPEAILPKDVGDLPKEFDWRTKGVVTEVKNQGQCGSCWAFSVTGNIEGQYALKYKKLIEFSEQELVDCDKTDEGCNGGLMDNAYRAIEQMGGLETEKDYPYDAQDEKCHFKKSLASVQLSGAVNISSNETDMAKWLTQNGPISIAINANAMQFYVGGVSHPLKFLCNPNNLDHGVLVVGYGVHNYPLFKRSLPYWIVKNSWGPSWGEQGYYRVYRGDGTCGLNKTPSSAIVA